MAEAIEFEVDISSKKRLCLYTVGVRGIALDSHPTTPAEFDAVAEKLGYVKTHGQEWWRGVYEELGKRSAMTESPLDTLRRIIAERDRVLKWEDSHTCHIDGVTYRGNEETIGKMEELSSRLQTYMDSSRLNGDMVTHLKRQLASRDETIVTLQQHTGDELDRLAKHFEIEPGRHIPIAVCEKYDEVKNRVEQSAKTIFQLSELNESLTTKLAVANSELQTLGVFGVSRYVKVAQRLNENSKDARPMRAMKVLADAMEEANEHTVPRIKSAATILLNWLWDNWLAAELEKEPG